MINKKAVKEGDIIVGNPLHQDVYDARGSLLLKGGCRVESQTQLDALLERGLYFLSIIPERLQDSSDQKSEPSSPFELIEKVYKLEALCSKQGSKMDFPAKIVDLCSHLQKACEIDEDASLGSVLLRKGSKYSINHQIHCAIVCEIISKSLRRSPTERLPLLAAALTMNIDILELQNQLFYQRDKLNEEQKIAVRNHPGQGTELLRSYGVTDEALLKTVLQHHEFIDGSGYPQGLQDPDICENARLLLLADIYCAKLFPRSYRSPLNPKVAAQEIFTGARGQHFDPDLKKIFIKELGIFHPGSFVRLENGERAVVTRRGEKIHQPSVHSVMKADGSRYLAPKLRDCSKAGFAIQDNVPYEEINININKSPLWGHD